MEIFTYNNKKETSKKAAELAILIMTEAIKKKGEAIFVVATGSSQLDFINHLIATKEIDWGKTKMFHLDEYINLPEDHPASFRNYLKKRFINKVSRIGKINLINGDAEMDPREECKRLNRLIEQEKIDVSFVGVGENGHLAFNDPPADFEETDPFIVVKLDKNCRQQQVNEGWFDSLAEVPTQAISMSISQIMKSNSIICTVPGQRKAKVIKECFSDETITPYKPATILKEKARCYLFLDKESSSLLGT